MANRDVPPTQYGGMMIPDEAFNVQRAYETFVYGSSTTDSGSITPEDILREQTRFFLIEEIPLPALLHGYRRNHRASYHTARGLRRDDCVHGRAGRRDGKHGPKHSNGAESGCPEHDGRNS